jgi:hypothetical protein
MAAETIGSFAPACGRVSGPAYTLFHSARVFLFHYSQRSRSSAPRRQRESLAPMALTQPIKPDITTQAVT